MNEIIAKPSTQNINKNFKYEQKYIKLNVKTKWKKFSIFSNTNITAYL